MFSSDLETLSVKNWGNAHRLLGMRINYNDEDGYDIDQEVAIVDMLKELGLRNARGTRTPVGDTTNDMPQNDVALSVCTTSGGVSVCTFQSLVERLLWISRCTRRKISYAVHLATRRTHYPTESDW
uniref:AlNc14C325G10625 protein n=1 Tax=Albugo laibachii Nc14 TaxID=890382 RepID=F0WWL3_9STRA|nr:AlNc14C325G10625 [Albugo laibachii Nc14]|eukprot:CCA25837.1 AlNc14C325G10625 [Albugo laibachii Nc14]